MKRIITLAAVMLALITTSCKKEGPQGPQGPQGPAGYDGRDANVKGGTATVNFTFNSSTGYGTADMTDDDITQSVVDKGAVLVYMSNGAGGWISLPYTDYSTTGVSISYYFVYNVGTVRVYFSEDDLLDTYLPASATFKVVAITAAQKMAHPNTDWKSYDAVMTMLSQSNTATHNQ